MNFFRRLFRRDQTVPARPLPLLEDIPEWFTRENRLPYPEWDRIGAWIETVLEPDDYHEAWNQAVRLWAAKFPLLPEGRIMCAESPEFILLTTAEASSRRWALQSLETAHRAIVKALDDLAWTSCPGKRTVFLLPEGLYARYIAAYHEEDYMGRSAGVFSR